ncbi:hypothetical protein STAS_10944 [Striga asiatica]|uniref:Uncharacterized protein n=1 Tax=Striga asiatica TaxID=4170 RepID=A0A5A7PPM7_STRAF|nr:hypothetical protein STAS_10944 [Striga asiatica]
MAANNQYRSMVLLHSLTENTPGITLDNFKYHIIHLHNITSMIKHRRKFPWPSPKPWTQSSSDPSPHKAAPQQHLQITKTIKQLLRNFLLKLNTNSKIKGQFRLEILESRMFTGANKADGGRRRRLGMDHNELEMGIFRRAGEEVIESPTQSVEAVFAVVEAYHHHRFLHGCKARSKLNRVNYQLIKVIEIREFGASYQWRIDSFLCAASGRGGQIVVIEFAKI